MFDKSFTPDQREEVGIQLMCQFEDTMQRFLEIMESRLTAPKSYDDEEFIQRCITMGMDEVKGVCWYLVELGIINRSDYDRHMYDFVIKVQKILNSDTDWKMTYHVW